MTTIGIIGCGNISDTYLRGAASSGIVTVKAVADLRPEVAKAKADAYGVGAMTVDHLLADDDIEIVLNLTVPLVHHEVSLAILAAGKHVYTEKPLAATLEDGRAVMAAAAAAGLAVGCAPDTFLGAGHQACRQAVDDGRIGEVVGAAASFLSHGMEHWHPDPTFFFKPGGGPTLDMAPYHLTVLINLIGPIRRVTAMTSTGFPARTVSSEGPMTGKAIDVEVPTTMHGVLAFDNGATASISTSWDVWKHDRRPIEIYGKAGSMLTPDPNFFGGRPLISRERGDWTPLEIDGFAFGAPNRHSSGGDAVADYRIIGLLDMAAALRAGRPFRASGAMGLHVLEVIDALGRSSIDGRHMDIESDIDRPEPLGDGEDERVFL